MFISRFYRIDTVTIPGMLLSVVELSSEDGYGVNETEVANTIHGDRDSLDAIMFTCMDGDVLGIGGLHKLIRALRPPHMTVVLKTDGMHPDALDDLVGAGYVDHVLFSFDGPLTDEQRASIDVAREGDCVFSAEIMTDPDIMDAKGVAAVSDELKGARMISLRRRASGKRFSKNEMASMAKSLKGLAKEVRVS